jgi:hypothetical protein
VTGIASSDIFQLLNYDHISHYFQTKLNFSQSVCTKAKSTATSLATCLREVTLTLCPQGQYDSFYFDLSSVLDFVLHIVPLDNLITYGLSPGFIIISRPSYFLFSRIISSPLIGQSGIPQCFWTFLVRYIPFF